MSRAKFALGKLVHAVGWMKVGLSNFYLQVASSTAYVPTSKYTERMPTNPRLNLTGAFCPLHFLSCE
jgi:hypothetical protein